MKNTCKARVLNSGPQVFVIILLILVFVGSNIH